MDNDDETLVNVTGGDAAEDTSAEGEDRGDEVTETTEDPAVDVAAAGEQEDADDDAPRTRQRIPKARFDQVNEERKTLAAELDEAKRELEQFRRGPTPQHAPPAPIAPMFDEVAKEREYLDAVMDDDRDRAIAIRREINAYQQEVAIDRYRSLQSAEHTMAALDSVTQQALKAYPYLDTPEGDEALESIIGLRDRKIQGGMAPHLALSQAVAAIAPRFAPDGDTGVASTDGGKTDRRTPAAVARGVADSGRQPPSLRGMGNRSTAGRVDITTMTEEQYDAMPDAERKRLRGDYTGIDA